MRNLILFVQRPGFWGNRRLAATALCALGLTACVSAPPPANTATTSPAPPSATAATGPEAGLFIGRPVAKLSAALGEPALARREGATAFHRYDIDKCRVYAMVAADGTVTALSTGPAVVGAPAEPFEACAARVR